MKLITITGQSLDDFFKDIPSGLKRPLKNRLRVLQNHGKECIEAFVTPYNDFYHFYVEDPTIPEYVEVHISFIDISNLIIIIDVFTYKRNF